MEYSGQSNLGTSMLCISVSDIFLKIGHGQNIGRSWENSAGQQKLAPTQTITENQAKPAPTD